MIKCVGETPYMRVGIKEIWWYGNLY